MSSNSILKVNTIQSLDGGAPTIVSEPSIPSGQQFALGGAVNVTGTLTADSFSGDGSSLTNLSTVTASKIIAYKFILGFDEYRS